MAASYEKARPLPILIHRASAACRRLLLLHHSCCSGGYEATREAAMTAFAKSWRRE
jgi:hypothetical protein